MEKVLDGSIAFDYCTPCWPFLHSDDDFVMLALRLSIAFSICLSLPLIAEAAVTDFSTWTKVTDPAHAGFSATQGGSSVTLSAGNLPVPAGTDIGFQSISGLTPQSSTSGFFFSPNADFSLAVDYAWSFSNTPTGFLGIGFGIGEDQNGENSAGVSMGTSNGSPLLSFAAAARVNDVDQTPLSLGNPILNPSTLSGTLFVGYEASSGDVILGAAPTQGAATAVYSATYTGIQNNWSDGDLMASFFLRSDAPPLTTAWQGGNADAVFSNFRVLSGSPVAIPEPSTAISSALILGVLNCRRRRRRR